MTSKNFIQRIVDNEVDSIVHDRFRRFSLGDFPRESVLIKITSKAVQVQTGFEYALDLYNLVSEMLVDYKENLVGEGVVVSSSKSLESDFEEIGIKIKSSRGKKYNITFDLSVEDFKTAVEKLSSYLLIFKFSIDGLNLKMKPSPPKPGSLKEKFATLKVDKKYGDKILKNFLFDLDDNGGKFKSAEIKQTFVIEDSIIPKEYENDYKLARLHAKKKGKIQRTILIDGEEKKSYEIDFEA